MVPKQWMSTMITISKGYRGRVITHKLESRTNSQSRVLVSNFETSSTLNKKKNTCGISTSTSTGRQHRLTKLNTTQIRKQNNRNNDHHITHNYKHQHIYNTLHKRNNGFTLHILYLDIFNNDIGKKGKQKNTCGNKQV